MTALTAEELLAWVEKTSANWQELITGHPEVWAMPCDILETGTVAGLLQHIVAVELRYAQRLQGIPESPYSDISMDAVAALFTFHDQAMVIYRTLISSKTIAWEEHLDFQTRSMGALRASRRTVLVHALMHTIRHYAQLATLVRQQGVKPGFPMDYLFMAASPVA